MIKVRLKGGLGNQMFQYAAGRAKALRNKTGLLLDVSYFDFVLPSVTRRNFSLDVFNISGKVIKRSFFRFILEKIFSRGNYFQSPKYFEGFEEVIRKDFTLREPLLGRSAELLAEIKNCSSVGVHVRRGDYVGSTVHPVLSESYYKAGIEYISQRSKIDKIYIFSDDIKWCEENLEFDHPVSFVGSEHSGKYGEVHMMLMSTCKNLVIANSTFSWWAGWLGGAPDKVIIAPKNWSRDHKTDTKDLLPRTWIRL